MKIFLRKNVCDNIEKEKKEKVVYLIVSRKEIVDWSISYVIILMKIVFQLITNKCFSSCLQWSLGGSLINRFRGKLFWRIFIQLINTPRQKKKKKKQTHFWLIDKLCLSGILFTPKNSLESKLWSKGFCNHRDVHHRTHDFDYRFIQIHHFSLDVIQSSENFIQFFHQMFIRMNELFFTWITSWDRIKDLNI